MGSDERVEVEPGGGERLENLQGQDTECSQLPRTPTF